MKSKNMQIKITIPISFFSFLSTYHIELISELLFGDSSTKEYGFIRFFFRVNVSSNVVG